MIDYSAEPVDWNQPISYSCTLNNDAMLPGMASPNGYMNRVKKVIKIEQGSFSWF